MVTSATSPSRTGQPKVSPFACRLAAPLAPRDSGLRPVQLPSKCAFDAESPRTVSEAENGRCRARGGDGRLLPDEALPAMLVHVATEGRTVVRSLEMSAAISYCAGSSSENAVGWVLASQ